MLIHILHVIVPFRCVVITVTKQTAPEQQNFAPRLGALYTLLTMHKTHGG